ncbi:MAG: LysR family transcriptional regulator [Treponema sp.]|jgi:DNA-binding transcriptional LysR family regulator|nr:LysR family transcriptional regulator [Treponema sp.]
MDMDKFNLFPFNKYGTFVVLAETLNYTETAELLYTSQGNVSKRIMDLEKDLDVKLFHRHPRTIELTDAGKLVLPYAKQLVETYAALNRAVRSFNDKKASQVFLQGIPTMASYGVFVLVSRFRNKYPDFTVNIEEIEGDALLLKNLEGGGCDIAFARIFDDPPENCDYICVVKEQYVAVLNEKRPLAKKASICLKELENDNFLQIGKKSMLYDNVVSLCESCGFRPHIPYEGKRIDIIADMIANGMGVSIVPKTIAEKISGHCVKIVPLDVSAVVEVGFLRQKKLHTRAVNAFWNFLKTQ